MRAVLYARVSTNEQSWESQLRDLRLGRPRLRVDERELQSIIGRRLPVRLAARELGVSPSSYLRLVRAQGGAASFGARARVAG